MHKSGFSEHDFADYLGPEKIRQSQIIAFTLTMGAFMYAVVVIYL